MVPSCEVTEEGLGHPLLGLELPWTVHTSDAWGPDGHLSIISRSPGPKLTLVTSWPPNGKGPLNFRVKMPKSKTVPDSSLPATHRVEGCTQLHRLNIQRHKPGSPGHHRQRSPEGSRQPLPSTFLALEKERRRSPLPASVEGGPFCPWPCSPCETSLALAPAPPLTKCEPYAAQGGTSH